MNDTGLKGLFRQIFSSPARLTERQQRLIRASFQSLLPIQKTTDTLFHERLLTIDPKLGVLLKGKMKAQGRGLTAVMGAVVDSSHCLRTLAPALRDLGRQLDNQGLVDRDYCTVAGVLIWTLQERLGSDFTAEASEAWTVCYDILANEMKFAASERKVSLLPPC